MALLELELPRDSQPQEAVGMLDVFGRPLFGFLPTVPSQDLSGNGCPIAQDTASRVVTPYGIGCTFSSGKWIKYDAAKAGGGSSDINPATRVYIVQYGAQAYQWLSHSNQAGSAEILGHGANIANMYCGQGGNDVILGSVENKPYVIVIRGNVYGLTSDAWVNGVFADSWTNTDARSGTVVYLGRRTVSDTEHFTGKLLGAYTLKGIVTIPHVMEICNNPWQVFEPEIISINVAASGGATFNPSWARGSNAIMTAGVI